MFECDLTNFVVIPGTQTMLATGKSGRVTRVDVTGDGMDASDATATIIGNMPAYYQGDRGLLGISLAGDYATTKHVNMLWDYCQSTTLASDDQACIPDGGLPTGRLSRMTLLGPATAPTGIDFTSEVVLMDNLPSWSPTNGAVCTDSHTVGTVITAPDGTLYVGNGDGSSYCGAMDPSSLSAQDVFSPRGKIFHINQDGTPVADNPFIAAKINGQNDYPIRDEYWAQRVWAYGLRNPFRFSLDGSTLRVGDVGWNTTEEQDVVNKGNNLGWPCLEGTTVTTLDNSPECNATFTDPLLTWPHVEVGRAAQSAAVGGVVVTSNYPAAQQGYWFGDYARGDLFVGDHQHPFGALGQWGSITSIQAGLGGDVMVSDIGAPGTGAGHITRIHYLGGDNAVPTARLVGTPLIGLSPLGVTFSPSAGDTDGTIRTWTMDFGDGSLPLSALNQPPATVSHTYTSPGSYRAILTVSDDLGATASATVTVNVGNNAPVLNVVPPQGLFHVGDALHVDATVRDPDGDAVSVQYQPVIHHCPSPGECHVHPGAFQDSPDFVFPSHGDDTPDYYLEIVVKATDSRGAVVQQSVTYLLDQTVPPVAPPVVPPVAPPVTPPQIQGLRFTQQPAERLVDTRTDAQPVQAGEQNAINLGGHSAAMLTVTVTQPQDTGFLRVYPCGTVPENSTVNYSTGQTVSNVAIVTIPADGWVCFLSQQTTDVVIDLSGYFDRDGALGYQPVDPTRVLDSRPNAFQAGHQVVFNLAEAPATAEAMMLNLTVDQPQADGYLRAYPCDAEANTSNVNYAAGQTIANFAAVEAPGGTLCFRSFANTQVIADLAGWFVGADGTTLTAVAPSRLFDTRSTPGFSRLAPGQELAVDLGLPRGIAAAVLNITVADPSANGYVQVYPCGTTTKTSSVNYTAHQVSAANMTVVKVPETGQVCFKSFAATDLIVDLSGWFGDAVTTPPSGPDPNTVAKCADFPGALGSVQNHNAAQAWWDYYRSPAIPNPGGLDHDGDGQACETS
jgi:glucose/arabinose dehydrogenase